MNCYRVEVEVAGREAYLVDAESEDEAPATSTSPTNGILT